MSDRDRFEAWISAPPHEYRLDRFAMDDTRYGRWSGQYINFAVQLAWEAWCAASEQRVPEGWKLVPIEPTEEMKDAMVLDHGVPITYDEARAVWDAGIAAAPKPEDDDD